MTQSIADQLGAAAVPHLKALLNNATFPRPDNVVAYLAYLGRDADSVSQLTSYSARLSAQSAASLDAMSSDKVKKLKYFDKNVTTG